MANVERGPVATRLILARSARTTSRARRRRPRGRSGGSSRRSRDRDLSSSWWTTSTGPSRRCSTCSSTCSASRAAPRSCSSASRAPTSSTPGRPGRHPGRVRASSPLATERRRVRGSDRGAHATARTCRSALRDRIVRRGRGQPAVRRADARHARRRPRRRRRDACRRRFTRSSPPESIASSRVNGRCSSALRSKVDCSTAAPSQSSCRRPAGRAGRRAPRPDAKGAAAT